MPVVSKEGSALMSLGEICLPPLPAETFLDLLEKEEPVGLILRCRLMTLTVISKIQRQLQLWREQEALMDVIDRLVKIFSS